VGSALRVLLDTNALYLSFYSAASLPPSALRAIRSAESVFVSLVSFWELAIKTKIGKMDAIKLLAGGPQTLSGFGFAVMGIEYSHILGTLELPLHHGDPFDRLLIAQSRAETLPVISSDRIFDHYGIKRIW
jgi:PIN domain nuclease of toxin-antitoxin system